MKIEATIKISFEVADDDTIYYLDRDDCMFFAKPSLVSNEILERVRNDRVQTIYISSAKVDGWKVKMSE